MLRDYKNIYPDSSIKLLVFGTVFNNEAHYSAEQISQLLELNDSFPW